MSDLKQRRNNRRENMSGTMHPGWKCFTLGWVVGSCTVVTMLTAMQAVLFNDGERWILTAIFGALALAAFWCGGSLAETLRPRRQQ